MSKVNYSIYDILDRIEKRPGMYVGDVTLGNLMTYMHGYEMAMRDAEVKDVSIPEFHGFHEFVRKKFGYYESTAGWANMILAVTIGLSPKNIIWENYNVGVTYEQHIESVKTFYKLLNEFRHK
ncbi:hypothetical protein [Methylomonas koyamae]|uniref:hypothetical protein n=1 Tax=Methylomonas koyamae TaxID=702114 RepID=UPI002873257E|nr:hypothetical protein [Methylomonas koyamae]WNB74442.1 hypothetical protein RI210_14255 [Methylomonas koyamae]